MKQIKKINFSLGLIFCKMQHVYVIKKAMFEFSNIAFF